MTIDDERPEDELHSARAGELLTVIALVYRETNGEPGHGWIRCPMCKGRLTFTVGPRPRRRITAACERPGCINFTARDEEGRTCSA